MLMMYVRLGIFIKRRSPFLFLSALVVLFCFTAPNFTVTNSITGFRGQKQLVEFVRIWMSELPKAKHSVPLGKLPFENNCFDVEPDCYEGECYVS